MRCRSASRASSSATNSALSSSPEAINADPYGKGWMMVVKLSEPGAAAGLMDAAAYKAFVESESK